MSFRKNIFPFGTIWHDIYAYLWKSKDGDQNDKPSLIQIPDTLIYMNYAPILWMFTGQKGKILKKNNGNITKQNILEAMQKGKKKCEIVARIIYPERSEHFKHPFDNEDLDEYDKKKEQKQKSQKIKMHYFTIEQLEEFLSNNEKYQACILQKFVQPFHENMEVIQVQFSPSLMIMEKKVSKQKISNTKVDIYERVCTYDGPLQFCDTQSIREGTSVNMKHIANKLIEHIEMVTHSLITVKNVYLYFQQDFDGKLWFLYAQRLKEDKLKDNEKLTQQMSEIGPPDIKMQADVENLRTIFTSRPIHVQKDIICLKCGLKDKKQAFYDITYKHIIQSFNYQKQNERENIPSKLANQLKAHQLLNQNADDQLIYKEMSIPPILKLLYPKLTEKDYLEKCNCNDFLCTKIEVCQNCYLQFTDYFEQYALREIRNFKVGKSQDKKESKTKLRSISAYNLQANKNQNSNSFIENKNNINNYYFNQQLNYQENVKNQKLSWFQDSTREQTARTNRSNTSMNNIKSNLFSIKELKPEENAIFTSTTSRKRQVRSHTNNTPGQFGGSYSKSYQKLQPIVQRQQTLNQDQRKGWGVRPQTNNKERSITTGYRQPASYYLLKNKSPQQQQQKNQNSKFINGPYYKVLQDKTLKTESSFNEQSSQNLSQIDHSQSQHNLSMNGNLKNIINTNQQNLQNNSQRSQEVQKLESLKFNAQSFMKKTISSQNKSPKQKENSQKSPNSNDLSKNSKSTQSLRSVRSLNQFKKSHQFSNMNLNNSNQNTVQKNKIQEIKQENSVETKENKSQQKQQNGQNQQQDDLVTTKKILYKPKKVQEQEEIQQQLEQEQLQEQQLKQQIKELEELLKQEDPKVKLIKSAQKTKIPKESIQAYTQDQQYVLKLDKKQFKQHQKLEKIKKQSQINFNNNNKK